MEKPPQQSPELIHEKKFLWQHNLDMLDGSMQTLLSRESIGGNAGKVEIGGKKYGCAAANGFADPNTGEIIMFGNIQDIPKHIIDTCEEFTLRIAVSLTKGFFRIVDIEMEERLSPAVRNSLHEAVTKYNIKHADDTL